MRRLSYHFWFAAFLFLGACATTPPDVAGTRSSVELRQIQTREYEDVDTMLAMRSVVATLQDLGFVIDKADAEIGTITATRYNKYEMRMTVTVQKRSAERVSVRANARIGEDLVEAPETYQDFFVALDKSIFLAKNKVD